MSQHRDHICVGVCTYKRPHYLNHLLSTLQKQRTSEGFTFSIVVVDNDLQESAKSTVNRFKASSPLSIQYIVEPNQNIALARNKTIENAVGNYFAGIDDDEFPHECWIKNLYSAMKYYQADGVLGPVLPVYDTKPPHWVVEGKLFIRQSFSTGTIIQNPKFTRSGNFMISRGAIQSCESLFDPNLGRTGGEDVDFFKRILGKGNKLVWSNEAVVYEAIPQARLQRRYFIRRAFLRGTVNSAHSALFSIDTAKSIVALLIYTASLPVLFLLSHHIFMKYLIKDCDHLSKLLARCNVRIIKQRPEISK